MLKDLCKHVDVLAVVADTTSAMSGHTTALQLALAHKERVCIMEEDAIPVEGFTERATAWAERFPYDLLSFYLGTGRPRYWAPYVERSLFDAAADNSDLIRVPQLIHGVCYSIPAYGVERVLKRLKGPVPDFSVGNAWNRPVVYPIESLVQHRDTASVERHVDGQQRVESRVARRLAAPLAYAP
jgi:hypothetical protein